MKRMLQWVLVLGLVISYPLIVAQKNNETEEVKEEAKTADDTASENKKEATDTEAEDIEEDVDEDDIDEDEEEPDEEEAVEEEAPKKAADEKPAEEPGKEEPAEEVVTEEETPKEAADEEPAEEPDEEKPAEEEVIETPAWKEGSDVDVEPEEMEVGPDEIMGIDTVDLEDPQGNWLYKRVWWERSEAKFEKIRELVSNILESRTAFFAKRAELDKNVLDPFYIKIGISQGELQEILAELINKLEQQVTERGDEEYKEKIEADKKSLQEVQADVQKVVKYDAEIEDAILTLVEQITKVRNLEQQAWQDFKSIARILDDKKAREMFYKVDGAWRNIKEMQGYIQGKFAKHFDQLIAKVKEQIGRVDQSVDLLKDRSIDLKKRMVGKAPLPEEEEEEEKAPRGFFSRFIIDPITSLFRTTWEIITWPFKKVFGLFGFGKTTQPADDENMEMEEEEVMEEVESPEAEKQALAMGAKDDFEMPDMAAFEGLDMSELQEIES